MLEDQKEELELLIFLKTQRLIRIICCSCIQITIFNLPISLVNQIYHMMMYILKNLMLLLRVLVE